MLAVIPLLIPNTLPYTLPTTTLFATCVIYGRLAHDNEILAIKAAGINLLHIVCPAVLLGALASAVDVRSVHGPDSDRRTTFCAPRSSATSKNCCTCMLKRDGRFCSDKVDYEIYVKRVESRTLIEAEFRRRDPKTKKYDVITWAREAELHVDLAKRKLKVTHAPLLPASAPTARSFSMNPAMRSTGKSDLPDVSQPTNRPSQMRWCKLFQKEAEYRKRERKSCRSWTAWRRRANWMTC